MRVKNHSGRNRYREWEKSFENGKVVPAAAGAAIKTKSGKKKERSYEELYTRENFSREE